MKSIPFPLVLDFGLIKLEVERACLVLKRKNREYPHITFFYEPKPGYGYWWPHVTWLHRGQKRHEELAKVRPRHLEGVAHRMEAALKPRFESCFSPVNLDELAAADWAVLVPSLQLVLEFLGIMLVGRNVFSFEKLEEVEASPDRMLRFLQVAMSHLQDPRDLRAYRPDGPVYAIRLSDDGRIEQKILYGYDFMGDGIISWFGVPKDVLNMPPSEVIPFFTPKLVEIVERVADVMNLSFTWPRKPNGTLIFPG